MIEININESLKDLEEQAVLSRKYLGLLKHDNKKRRIIYSLYLVFALFLLYWSFSIHYYNTVIVSGLVVIFGIYNIIYSQKINEKNIRRNFRRNFQLMSSKFSIDKGLNFTVKIYHDYLESISNNSTIKMEFKDYLNKYDEPDYYVIEFTQGRIIFLKKSAFENEEEFLSLIHNFTHE